MFKLNWGVLILLFATPSLWAADSNSELKQQVKLLIEQVQHLQATVQKMAIKQQEYEAKNTKETNSTKQNLAGQTVQYSQNSALVNLETEENLSLYETIDSHVLSNPWWKNFQIHGFAAVGFYDTGSAASRDFGGFEIKESSLFVEAEVWEDISFFLEVQANRLGKDEQLFIRTGEVYAHFRNIEWGDIPAFGIKLGRIDIPFGEEYLWQDSIDNPLITNSAAYPYGWDEGILVYSEFKGMNWILAVTDGSDVRSLEENSDKAVNLKFYGNPYDPLYLSASFMYNGDASKSAIEFGGSHFQPVGASHQSSLGNSASDQVDSGMLEFDAKYSFHLGSFDGYLATSMGAAFQNDTDSAFDRDIFWYSVEPFISYKNTWYAVVRYSEIGTYNDQEGYHFDGKTFAGGNNAFGYDTQQFQRLGLGLGWTPNSNLRAKLEIGQDWFDLISRSSLRSKNKHRKFVGVEVALGF